MLPKLARVACVARSTTGLPLTALPPRPPSHMTVHMTIHHEHGPVDGSSSALLTLRMRRAIHSYTPVEDDEPPVTAAAVELGLETVGRDALALRKRGEGQGEDGKARRQYEAEVDG